jgi:hypothetical protein
MLIHECAQFFQVDVRLWQVFAIRPFAFEEIWNRVGAKAVNAQVQPEARHVEHFLLHFGIIKIQIRLAGIKSMPVILACLFIPCPVGWLGFQKDDARVFVDLIGIAPDVIIAIGRVPVGARSLETRDARRMCDSARGP